MPHWVLPWADATQANALLKATSVSKSKSDSIAKRVQKIVLSFIVLVADPKAFDLVAKVIAGFTFVDCSLVKGILGVFDVTAVDIPGNRECSLILAHRGQFG